MLVFLKNEICLMQVDDDSYEEVEIIEEIHQREINFSDHNKLWFVYKVCFSLVPDITLYVKPEILFKLPDKNTITTWDACPWKPKL